MSKCGCYICIAIVIYMVGTACRKDGANATGNNGDAHVSAGARKIDQISLVPTLTLRDVEEHWGPPDREVPLNFLVVRYRMSDGRDLLLVFDCMSPHELVRAERMDDRGEKVSAIFEESPESLRIRHSSARKADCDASTRPCKTRRLEDLALTADTTEKEIIEKWGPADSVGGSGERFPVFILDNGESAVFSFDPRSGKLLMAAHADAYFGVLNTLFPQ